MTQAQQLAARWSGMTFQQTADDLTANRFDCEEIDQYAGHTGGYSTLLFPDGSTLTTCYADDADSTVALSF